jgi:hypothetical protein
VFLPNVIAEADSVDRIEGPIVGLVPLAETLNAQLVVAMRDGAANVFRFPLAGGAHPGWPAIGKELAHAHHHWFSPV